MEPDWKREGEEPKNRFRKWLPVGVMLGSRPE